MQEELFELIKVVYEDGEVLVLDKPAGIVVTSEGVTKEKTLQDWLKDHYPVLASIERQGIVHRLDKGTSGLIVIGKTEEAVKDLKYQFKERRVRKKYVALLGGDASLDGEIKAPIKRSRYVFGRWQVDPEGKQAWTIFKQLGKYKRNNKLYSLVEVDLKTGRTHQIRVHFSYLRWPLVGDPLYGGERLISRPFLESKYLEFEHPLSHEKMHFELPLSCDLAEELSHYEKV